MSKTAELPSRQATGMSVMSDDAVPDVDPSSTAGILAERLQAWKHAVGYLEEYMGSVERIHKAQSKEYERVLKTISHPLKEGHHFDQSLGGVAGFFENMRTNTQALINTNLETEKSIKGSVLPILERLHKEIKNKAKELAHGAQKGAKEIEKARNTTQKHIELLGQHTASFESTGGKITPTDDPYVLQRGVIHRLGKQVMEENNHKNDLIAIQNNFQAFEAHVIATMQQAMEAFNLYSGGQAERVRALYSDMLRAAQKIPPDFEWKKFVARNGSILMDPNEPLRVVEGITFPNQNHPSTKPLIEGTLERKSRNKLSWGTSTAYYVVTPAKFLHEYKDSDNMRKDPTPELSIYLPEAIIGTPSGDKFNVKGKDRSKGLSSKLAGSSELSFKAHTPQDAERWYEVIRAVAGTGAKTEQYESLPTSPVAVTAGEGSGSGSKPASPAAEDLKAAEAGAAAPTGTTSSTTAAADHVATGHETGITGGDPVASPTTVSPTTAAPAPAAAPKPAAA